MDLTVIWIIAALGCVALVGVFARMKPGFGPFNLKIVGLVFVATLTSVLALSDGKSVTAAMGILGAIAGYLFGLKEGPKQP